MNAVQNESETGWSSVNIYVRVKRPNLGKKREEKRERKMSVAPMRKAINDVRLSDEGNNPHPYYKN